ncbi:type IV secretion protein Rhs [Sorangium cellulosum]|uniref:Type IV secretion protein Rhs n=1 Tax=Sorangium cellulosum TaxID=56 RepID=A0A2L0EW22_SORCE|nr:type VI secretion system tip protein VgrG [Sorangium cellulosum]AUX43472.1 type IV secretion protein Rhs [Sorangium cellulosum]
MPGSSDHTTFALSIDGVSAALSVASFEGSEGISELYAFQIEVTTPQGDLDPEGIIGAKATLTITTAEQAPRYVGGIVSHIEAGELTDRSAVYRVSLVPAVFRLLYRHDARIFQEKTAAEIIEAVFAAAAVDGYRLALQGSYTTREYSVQYRESDWAFVSRLMEQEGMFYYFEHGEDAHTLVIADAKQYVDIVAPETVAYRPPLGAMARGESVSRFVFGRELRPGKVSVTDFNFKKPGLSLMSTAAGAAESELEVYDYPGEFELPDGGAALSKVRLGEWEAFRRWGAGESGCARLTPGYAFTLSEHPRDAMNRRYLVTRVHHTGVAPQMADTREIVKSYENRFEIIPDDVLFRPPRRTPRPFMRGVQTAIVTGPSGEEIHVDEHGRVKVQFHWDRAGKRDEKSSCWIRVSQVWAGAGYGAMWIPRIGHEVVVDFLEGDPDRPLIVGRVYHGLNVPPYPLPAEKTKSTLRSNSSPDSGGSNELRFEDKLGAEEVYLHAQKDWNIRVENDKTQEVGHDEQLSVGNDRKKKVERNQSEDVGNDKSINVGGNHVEAIAGNESQDIGANATKNIGGAFIAAITAGANASVGGPATVNVGGKLSVGIGAGKEENVGAESVETVGKDKKVSVGADLKTDVTGTAAITIGKDESVSVGGEQKIEVKEKITITCGDATVVIDKSGDVTVKGKDIKVEGTGKVLVKAASKVIIASDGPVEMEAAAAVKIKGSAVNIN